MAWYNVFSKKSTTYNTEDLIRDIQTGQSSAVHRITEYNPNANIVQVFEENTIGYMCASTIARNFAKIDLNLFDKDKEITNKNNPMVKRLRNPGPAMSQFEMLEKIALHLQLTGNAYVLRNIVDSNDTQRTIRTGGFEFIVLDPVQVRVVTSSRGMFPDRYELMQFNQGKDPIVQRVWEVDPITGDCDVLHLKLPNPRNQYLGMPPAKPAYRAVAGYNAAQDYNYNNMMTGGMPKWMMWLKPYADGIQRALNKDQEAAMIRKIKEFGGPNSKSQTLITHGDWELKELGTSAREMEFIQAKQEDSRDIARAFGVPTLMLGIPGDNTYNNVREAKLEFFTQTILPLMDRFCDAFNRWMMPVWGDNFNVRYDVDSIEALDPMRQAKWTSISQAYKDGIITLEEARDALGYEVVIAETPAEDVVT